MTTIDARGMRCPWPAIRLAKALRERSAQVRLWADDPAAPRELALVAAAAGATIRTVEPHLFHVEIAG